MRLAFEVSRPNITNGGMRGLRAIVAIVAMCGSLAACGSTVKTRSNRVPGGSSETTTTISSLRLPNGEPAVPPGRTYLPPSKTASVSHVPVSMGPGASTSTVSIVRPDASTLAALGLAFGKYETFPSTCKMNTVPRTVHVARVMATGVMWALSEFEPDPTCMVLHDGKLETPANIGPFGEVPPPPVGVFAQRPGQQWQMNSEAGKPFPCPPAPGQAALVPEEVLKAWDIPYYSPGCISYPPSEVR